MLDVKPDFLLGWYFRDIFNVYFLIIFYFKRRKLTFWVFLSSDMLLKTDNFLFWTKTLFRLSSLPLNTHTHTHTHTQCLLRVFILFHSKNKFCDDWSLKIIRKSLSFPPQDYFAEHLRLSWSLMRWVKIQNSTSLYFCS